MAEDGDIHPKPEALERTSTRGESDLVRRGLNLLSEGAGRGTSTNEPTLVVNVNGRLGTYRTISDALNVAPIGARIRVHPGTYREQVVLVKAVELVAEGAGEHRIETDGGECVLVKTAGAVLRGFAISGNAPPKGTEHYPAVQVTAGDLLLEECDIKAAWSAGVWVEGPESSATVRTSRIHGCRQGGVVAVGNKSAVLEDCDVFDNFNAGIAVVNSGHVAATRCKIRDNHQVGVAFMGSHGELEECDIFGNPLGIGIKEGANPTVRRCSIHHATIYGIGAEHRGEGVIEDTDIHSNMVAGVLIGVISNTTVRRCRIHGNSNAGVAAEFGRGTVEDCDIFGNAVADVALKGAGNTMIRRCRIHDAPSTGILLIEESTATIEDCEVFGHTTTEIGVQGKSRPTITGSKIHSSGGSNVMFQLGGEGLLERCTISDAKQAGIVLETGSNPTVRFTRIEGNQWGVYVMSGGGGTVEHCTLAANLLGHWRIVGTHKVDRRQNIEQ